LGISEDIPTGTVLEKEKRAGLQKFLEDSFGLHDLKALAFELGTGHETFARTLKGPLIRDLLRFCERRNQFGSLLAEMRRLRPGHPFLALWSAKLLAVPRTKVQLTIVEGYDGAFNQREVQEGVAGLFELRLEEIVLMGAAVGTTRLLLSLPHRTDPPHVMLGSHRFCKGRYEIIALESFDAVDASSRQAWRLVALEYPPRRWLNGLQPRVSWREAIQDSGIATPPLEDAAVAPARVHRRKVPSWPLLLAALRLPTVACGSTLLVAALLIFICAVLAAAFLMRWQGTRAEMIVQTASVAQAQTMAAFEAVGTTTLPVATATREAALQVGPSSTPTQVPTPIPSNTPGPTSTPLRPSPAATRTRRAPTATRAPPTSTPTPEALASTSVPPTAAATRLMSTSMPAPSVQAPAVGPTVPSVGPTTPSVGPTAPRPVAPLDGERFGGGRLILLRWAWEGDLGTDGIYSVRVWPKSEGPTQTCARDHYWRHGLTRGPIQEPWYLFSPSDCPGQRMLCWDVHAAVEDEVGWRQLSPYSVPWCFSVEPAAN
jgi:hypothetical protein